MKFWVAPKLIGEESREALKKLSFGSGAFLRFPTLLKNLNALIQLNVFQRFFTYERGIIRIGSLIVVSLTSAC